MKYLFSLFALLWSAFAFSQIKTLEIEKEAMPESKPAVGVYDGSVNFLPKKDLEKYVGQVFYMPKSTDKEGYFRGRFYIKNPKMKKNAPVLIDSKRFLDAMGRYYDVVGVEDIEMYGRMYRHLLLKDKEDGAVYFYGYGDFVSENSFPFVVMSYYEKTRKAMVGDTLYYNGFDIRGYYSGEKEIENQEIAPFVCTDYVLDETGKDWQEVLCMEYGDVKFRMPMKLALKNSKTDFAVSIYRSDIKSSEEAMKRNAENNRRDQADIETTFSEAKKLIGTTIYNYNYLGTINKASSINAKEGGEGVAFDINTPFKVIHVGKDEKDRFHAMLYFTSTDGQLYMRSVCFHSTISRDYFDENFSKDDIRKKYKHISEKSWNFIKRGVSEIGMTMEECRLAKGYAPESINSIETSQGRTTIVRYYQANLYFRNGRLVAIQD